MLGKTFKGLTDEMLAWQTERLQELAVDRDDWVVHVRPELVVEIAFDGVQTLAALSGRDGAAVRPGAAAPAGQARGRSGHRRRRPRDPRPLTVRPASDRRPDERVPAGRREPDDPST